MNKLSFRFNSLCALSLLATTGAIGCAHSQQAATTTPSAVTAPAAAAAPATTPQKTMAPSWEKNAVIYCAYPQIFSKNGLNGITAQLPRLKQLGVTVLWLMPFQPLGHDVTLGGVARNTLTPPTPYDQEDLKGIDPAEGNAADLTKLMTQAHAAGMHVILDVCINQTAWSDPLIQSHPEYYYHTDGNVHNPNSIDVGFPNAFRDADIAGVDLRTDQYGAQTYMKGVLRYWLNTFKFDGFRVDSADSPAGPTRDLVQPYAQSLVGSLDPGNTQMWLEEGNTPTLAFSPYNLDYLWDISFYAANGGGNYLLQGVAKSGSGVSAVESKVTSDLGGGATGFPEGFQHMTFLQDWDTPQDYSSASCGGYPQVLAAAAFNLTIPGVPLIYNGEEVGNDKGLDHLNHEKIDWNSPHAAKFTAFYKAMTALRRANPALNQGSLVWTRNSNDSNSVSTFYRLSGSNQCYVEINFSGKPQAGTIARPGGTGVWSDVSPSVSPGGASHALPSTGKYKLAAYDYAVFKRAAANVPAPPAGSQQAAMGLGASGGSANLSGSLTTYTSAQTINLTTEGASDWAAWGFGGGNAGFDQKASGGGKISNAAAVGGSLNAFQNDTLGFTWTDGRPDASETGERKGYYNQGGNGDGFSLTVPAASAQQTLTVYVGGYASSGTLTAALSGDPAAPYKNATLTSGGSYYGAFTLKFKATKPGQTLTVKWLQSSPGTNVTLYAATLK